jgi:hypothetical protein
MHQELPNRRADTNSRRYLRIEGTSRSRYARSASKHDTKYVQKLTEKTHD